MTIFNVFSMLGGVALFLYGMHIMGGGLEKLAGGKTQTILQKLTSSTFKGVLLGAVITALIQSSAGTTVVVIGLVNSGILTLVQAVGVIMGANIGTTITGQILRLADISGDNFFLQMLQPKNFAPIVAFAGVILIMFFKSNKKNIVGQILLGFGILFTGLFTTETAMAPLQDSEVFRNMFANLSNPVVGIVAGALVTVALQSSSASLGILQALSSTGVVTWGNAIPIILGQNIGTTSTGLIASSGASKSAKRVAFVHLYFNLIGTSLFIAVIYISKAIFGFEWWGDVIGRGAIADFHSIFNIAVTVLFIPFARVLVKLAELTVPDKGDTSHPELDITILDERLYASPSVAISQARKALEQMIDVSLLNQKDAMDILMNYSEEKLLLAQQREEVVDKLDVGVTNYLVNMSDLDLNEDENREISALLNTATEFERIGDYIINVIERSGEVYDKEITFSDMAVKELEILSGAIAEVLNITGMAFRHEDMLEAAKVEPLEQIVDLICESLRTKHIDRVKNGQCNIDAGIVFLEVLNDYERVSDHCSNVAARMLASANENEIDVHELRRQMHEDGSEQYKHAIEEYNQKYFVSIANVSKQ